MLDAQNAQLQNPTKSLVLLALVLPLYAGFTKTHTP